MVKHIKSFMKFEAWFNTWLIDDNLGWEVSTLLGQKVIRIVDLHGGTKIHDMRTVGPRLANRIAEEYGVKEHAH